MVVKFVFGNNVFIPNNQRGQMDFFRKTEEKKSKSRFPQSLSRVIIWYEYDKTDEYYKKAKLIRHKTHTRNGHHVDGYNICPECAKKLKWKCDLCDRKLKRENHSNYRGGCQNHN